MDNEEVTEEAVLNDVAEVEADMQADGEEQPDVDTDSGLDAEARARQLGWKPKDEFRGPPEAWSDAETFIERGEQELPILRSNLRTTQEKLAAMERTVHKLFNDQTENARNSVRERALKAAELGDKDEVDRAIAELGKTYEQPVQNDADLVRDFQIRNDWYGTDAELTRFAQAESSRLATLGVTDVNEQLRLVEQAVERKRSAPARKAPPPPDSAGGRRPSAKPQQKTWGHIPKEDQRDLQHIINSGVSKEDAVKIYWENNNG